MQVKEIEAFYDVCTTSDQSLIKQEWNKLWNWFIKEKRQEYSSISYRESVQRLISEKNYNVRRNIQSSKAMGLQVYPGDICYIDFGQAYLYEAGYQHFGLVLSIVHYKALVIPMTSNPQTYQKAFGKDGTYLYPLGKIEGRNRESVLFLNDAKFINTARIIDVKAHLDVAGPKFKAIKEIFKTSMLG